MEELNPGESRHSSERNIKNNRVIDIICIGIFRLSYTRAKHKFAINRLTRSDRMGEKEQTINHETKYFHCRNCRSCLLHSSFG